jgi:5-(carboxyamino)imidazole ribonucleotide synthase
MTAVRSRAALAAAWLSTAHWPDGWSVHVGRIEQEVQRA